MPFNLSQIFGGWRKKETKRAMRTVNEHSSLPAGRAGCVRTPEAAKAAGASDARIKEFSEPTRKVSQVKSQSELARKLLTSPHISEKATMLGEGRYVFKVADGANKNALKKAVRDRYGVEVRSVNIVAERDKTRRRGQIAGVKSGFKKAVVTLKAGQVISEF